MKRRVRRWTKRWVEASFYGTIGAARGVATYASNVMGIPARVLSFDVVDEEPCEDFDYVNF